MTLLRMLELGRSFGFIWLPQVYSSICRLNGIYFPKEIDMNRQ